VERVLVVHGHLVELREREVLHLPPRDAAVVADRDAAVVGPGSDGADRAG
jgi:hypothetical protein